MSDNKIAEAIRTEASYGRCIRDQNTRRMVVCAVFMVADKIYEVLKEEDPTLIKSVFLVRCGFPVGQQTYLEVKAALYEE